jgi:hypothetical protein
MGKRPLSPDAARRVEQLFRNECSGAPPYRMMDTGRGPPIDVFSPSYCTGYTPASEILERSSCCTVECLGATGEFDGRWFRGRRIETRWRRSLALHVSHAISFVPNALLGIGSISDSPNLVSEDMYIRVTMLNGSCEECCQRFVGLRPGKVVFRELLADELYVVFFEFFAVWLPDHVCEKSIRFLQAHDLECVNPALSVGEGRHPYVSPRATECATITGASAE